MAPESVVSRAGIKLRAMIKVSNDARILDGCMPDTLPLNELLSFGRPTVLKGIARLFVAIRIKG